MTQTHPSGDPATASAQADELTVRSPRKPPRWLFHLVMNPLMRVALRTPIGARRLGGVLLLLTYTGRRSGRRITIPVGYQRAGDELRLFTHSPWWRNFQGGAPVSVRLAGRDVSGWAEFTRDVAAILPPFRDMLRQRGPRGGQPFGITPQPRQELTDQYLAETLRSQGLALVRVRLRA